MKINKLKTVTARKECEKCEWTAVIISRINLDD